ncbi:MAG: cation diffusion facilitator family transporter [Treponema sp.]|nr:cation diffusion facilitator family transporter [Treponema sp.]
MDDKLKVKYIRIAGTVALIGNAILALLKIVLGHISNSLAVTGDGIDSATDVLIAIVTLIIGKIIAKPSDKEHPWGHGRAETTATLSLAFIIFIAGFNIISQAIRSLIAGNFQETSFVAIIAAIMSIIGKTILAAVQNHYGKKASSDILKANAQNMKNDIVLSFSILLGLFLSKIFKSKIIDPVIALIVGAWIIKNAFILFSEMTSELMDGNTDNSLYKKLFEAVSSVEGVANPHSARIRKIASKYDIDLDIEVAPDIPIYEAHELTEQVEDAIRKAIPDIYAITIHIEPCGSDDHQRREEFGLSPLSLV